MPRTQHEVRLSAEDRRTLTRFVCTETATGRAHTRARMLLLADRASGQSRQYDAQIAAVLGCASRTVARTRAAWTRRGMAAVHPRPRAGTPPRKLSDEQVTRVLALTVGDPPVGHQHWTMRLLAQRTVELGIVASICPETIRTTLKKTGYAPGRSAAS